MAVLSIFLRDDWKRLGVRPKRAARDDLNRRGDRKSMKLFHWASEQPAGTVKPMAGR
jgi:hypothetical protein